MNSNYQIVNIEPNKSITLRDLGPWDQFMSVTNDAEAVVQKLVRSGRLQPGMRLFYYDSEDNLDEILVRDGEFAGFAPGPS